MTLLKVITYLEFFEHSARSIMENVCNYIGLSSVRGLRCSILESINHAYNLLIGFPFHQLMPFRATFKSVQYSPHHSMSVSTLHIHKEQTGTLEF